MADLGLRMGMCIGGSGRIMLCMGMGSQRRLMEGCTRGIGLIIK